MAASGERNPFCLGEKNGPMTGEKHAGDEVRYINIALTNVGNPAHGLLASFRCSAT